LFIQNFTFISKSPELLDKNFIMFDARGMPARRQFLTEYMTINFTLKN
jgi:hypothetical protein